MNYTALRASAKNQGLIFRALDKPDPNLIHGTLKKKKLLLTLYIIYMYIFLIFFFHLAWSRSR